MTATSGLRALGLGVLFVAATARAQLADCQALGAPGAQYKVAIDDLSIASATVPVDPELAQLRERLQFSLHGRIEALQAAASAKSPTLSVPLSVVDCKVRRPSVTGAEFTPQLAETLSNSRVVLEFWGTVEPRTGAAQSLTARLGYVIPPVMFYDSAAPSLHLIQYPKVAAGGATVEGLEDLPELSAFALVGLATKADRAKNYDLAAWAFTNAEAAIGDAQRAGRTTSVENLARYVERQSCLMRNRARTDQEYSGGLKATLREECPQ